MGRICVKYHKSFPYRKYLAEVPLLYFQTDIEQVSCIGFGQFIGLSMVNVTEVDVSSFRHSV